MSRYAEHAVKELSNYDYQNNNYVMILKGDFEVLTYDYYNLTAIHDLEKMFNQFNPF